MKSPHAVKRFVVYWRFSLVFGMETSTGMLTPEEVLDGLTEPQREAATCVDGPLLVLAGAGSGKTRTITRRIAYMVACGIPAWNILAITFTNKAAGEMRERVQDLLKDAGRMGRGVTVCTFHSLCARLLREFAEVANLPKTFSIFDSADQTKTVKQAIKDCNISAENFQPAAVLSAISKAKNKLQSPATFAKDAIAYFEKNVARVYLRYEQILAANKAVDFDDLLLKMAVMLRDNKEVRTQLQERYQYILIDEYQDTNHAQFILAHMLAMEHKNICATGDPDQSIYGWRGANINNILEFEQFYPNAKTVLLEQNYRSTKTILKAASELIANNSKRKKKDLWTENEEGPKIQLVCCNDEHQEASEVVRRLKGQHEEGGGGVPWDKMAVFYRVNSLSRVLEDALMKQGVPYQIARGTEFYGRKEIKDVLAYLRVISNPSDSASLMRIINVPTRGLGDTSVTKIELYASGHGMTLLEACAVADQIPDMTTRAINAAKKLADLFASWRSAIEGVSPGTAVPGLDGGIRGLMEKVVKESGFESDVKKKDAGEEGDTARLANIEELITVAAEFDTQNPEGTLDDYLQQVTLISDVDKIKDSGGAVTLMTLHAAKGLEFPFVAMVGMEDGLIPHMRAIGFASNPDEMEEERRLAFVGITRAMKHLVISHAKSRMIRGQTERAVRSQFLDEMPVDCFEEVDLTGDGNSKFEIRNSPPPFQVQNSNVQNESHAKAHGFKQGMLVRHPHFGLGRIESISVSGVTTKVDVRFQGGAGKKTLLLQFAKLERVDG